MYLIERKNERKKKVDTKAYAKQQHKQTIFVFLLHENNNDEFVEISLYLILMPLINFHFPTRLDDI